MKNEIRIRKRRFLAGMLTFLLLLNQLAPFPAHAADAYGVEDLYEGQILNPDDTISNSADTSCAITYFDHGETGGELSSGTIAQNVPYTVPAYTGNIPDGFEFTGWQVLYVSIASGDVVESITLQAMVAINGTEIGDALYDTMLYPGTMIYSQWDTYALTYYDPDGNPLGEAQTISANTPYTVIGYSGTVPEGSQFTGWKVSYVWASGGTGSIELTAQFALNQYTITFDTNGGSPVDPITADYGAAVTAPADPTRTGYTFAGWDREIPTTMPAENITITAQWTANKYTIWFVDEDGTQLQSSEAAYGETPVYSGETPTKAATAEHGYNFAGWIPEIVEVTGDATYTATYTETVNKYTIEFVNDDGTELQSSEVAYGETPVYRGETPTKEATAQYTYTFAGWDSEVVSVTGEATYTATYTESVNKYTIRFVNEDGTTLQSGEVPYGEAPVYRGATPTKEATAEYSYTFDGWTPGITEVTGDTTYTATYTAGVNQYTITFDTDGGSAIGAITADYGAAITAPANPTREGYTFAGWDKSIPTTMPAEHMTIKAYWNVNQYTITFDTDGGSKIASITQDYGTTVTAPANPNKNGYTFAGWDKTIPATMPAENMTVTAQWDVNKYTIKFVNEDGTQLQSTEVAYGETPVYSGETPTKAATAEYTYAFAGWSPEVVAVTGEATYTATYTETANQYTITFDTAGGSSVAPITQAYGTAVTAPNDPTRTGYTFVNWNPEIPATMPAEDITILARWTANEYTISFNTDGGSNVDAITQNYGTTVTAPANPTKTGYTFAGWDKAIPTTMPAENVTITARWTAESYSIRYILNGGTNGENPGSYTYGTGVSGFANAAKPGYNFVGWYENADFSGDKVTSVAANRTGDITLYAKFEMGTIEAGTYSLTAGVAYKLGNVTKVSGDNSVYTAGSIFYVPTSGTYTFS